MYRTRKSCPHSLILIPFLTEEITIIFELSAAIVLSDLL